MFREKGHLLRIYIGESDKKEGIPLYEWIVRKASDSNLAGATVLRGMEGFGTHNQIHTAKILRMSDDLPVVIEIVDEREKIESFMNQIDHVIKEGMATLEKVEIHFYRKEERR